MENFIIYGGKRLKGEVEIKGAKNATFPVLAATLLTKETCFIDNLPIIEDALKMLNILKGMGAKIDWEGERKIRINCENVDLDRIPFELINYFRGSVLIIGPLLARFGRLKISSPGGCLIGVRDINTHLDAFSQLGFNCFKKGNFYYFEKKRKNKNLEEVILNEFSVTATENVLLYSALNPKKTILKIADQDYQVQELIKVLKKMGVMIKEKAGHVLEIKGKKGFLNGFQHTIISDPIETGTFIIIALATKGEVLVKKAELSFLTLFLKKLKDAGAKFKILDSQTIKIFPSQNLKIEKIQSLPYPGLHSDLQPELGVLATQTKGIVLIHDPLFEGRLKYLEELNKMGANIIFCDPHRAIIYGPTSLKGITIPSPDLRGGAALVIAGLIAKGKTVIKNIYQIDRGYEKIEERLKKLGADIERVEDKEE